MHADAGQIQQVLMNLVINASEAIGESHGVINIETSQEEASGDGAANRYVVITVRDTGCGMSENTKARIFDPFFTTKIYGRGLGLAAVLGILRSCAATITIESAPGKGSTFRVRFPAAVESTEATDDPAQPEVPKRQGTVMVVEDEDFVRTFASAALRRAGYCVLEASQGQEALDLLNSHGQVDLVLLDVTMPMMSGRETLQHIRRMRPELRVIVTSGYGSQEAKSLMDLVGEETEFLQKPYTSRRLIQSIDGILAE